MKTFASFCVMVLLSVSSIGYAADIVVNSTDSTTTPPPGETNLWLAISLLQNGDTIKFSIAGAGPHYLATPPGGYPLITKNNVTIDGYSQPGAVPNTNPILATNNAQIKIVLTSTNDNFTSMDYNSSTNTQAGFGPGSFALLGIDRATNVQIRGLCLLGGSVGGLSEHFGIAIARDRFTPAAGVHVNGCWIGVAPDGTTVKDFDDAIHASSHRYEASYRFRGTNAGCVFDITLNNRNPGVWESDRELITIFRATNTCPEQMAFPPLGSPAVNGSSGRYVHFNHVIGVKAGSLNPRAEFNVIVGGTIPIIMEGYGFRVSGNFLGVLPDGVTQYLVPLAQLGRFAESFIEIGRGVSDVVIGTDGDGVNDADERNVIGGVVTDGGGGSINRNGYRHVVEFYSASGALNATNGPGDDRQRIRVSGNYVGIGVDGVTRFTNGVPILNGSSTAGTHFLVGSDFDGVSDAVEGNVFYGNYPPGYYYATAYTNSPRSGSGSHGFFDEPDPNAGGFSTRGNKVVNCYPYPFNPQRNNSFANITNYVNKALASPTTSYYALYPVISASSTTARLIGTAPANNATYPYLIIDVYLPDPEGLTNGLVVPDPFLTNGWVHGKTYLGSFLDNGVLDSDPTVGSFNFSVCSLSLTAGTKVTVSANYSKDVPGTHNARVLTSLFANPVALGAGSCLTVNTTSETPGPGEMNLAMAISNLTDGATITFGIPGEGPHYIPTPTGGYPLLTKNNVTIDGWSQPGAWPNMNTVLSRNNARIKIVLTSTNDNFTSMDYNSSTNTQAGFGPGSFALLGIDRATNVQIRGLCLLGGSVGGLSEHFGIAIARDRFTPAAGVHVNGCWIGVAPDGTTVKDFDDAIHASSHRYEASYRFRGTNAGCVFDITLNNRNPGVWESDRELITIFRATNTCPEQMAFPPLGSPAVNGSSGRYVHFNHVIGVKAGSLNPRAEFNVIVGGTIPIIMEGYGFRVSGNFLGVLPDGVTQYLVPLAQLGRFAESFIEIGRGVSDVVIGTDGDGVNDADERNVIGGVVTDGGGGSINRNGYRHVVEFYSASGALNATNGPGDDRQRIRVSGNYVGIGVDGVTRFTNGVPILNGSSTAGTHFLVGSDFDGVSDAVEGNVFYGNYPPGYYYATAYTNSPRSGSGSHGFFDEPDPNAGGFSTRGNKVVNCYPYPFNPQRNNSFANITNYVNKALASPTTSYYALYPVISASSTTARLIGTAPANNATYPYLIIDVYLPDPEGLTNGLVVPDPFLTNGWVHGKTYLGSFLDNGVLDSDPTVGSFNFSICSLGLANGTQFTISANYSKDAPGTHNARVLTSLFANPVTVGAGIVITSVSPSGGSVTINWCGGAPPYTLQKKTLITDAWADVQTGITGTSATNAISGGSAFYQVIGKSN